MVESFICKYSSSIIFSSLFPSHLISRLWDFLSVSKQKYCFYGHGTDFLPQSFQLLNSKGSFMVQSINTSIFIFETGYCESSVSLQI